MSDLLIPFANLNGNIVDAISVTSGLACNCICLHCGERVIARKGKRNRHHFAHQSSDCNASYESALHLAAKFALQRALKLCVPEVLADVTYSKRTILFPAQQLTFEYGDTEKDYDSIVADVVFYARAKPLIIEIAVTHKVDPAKLEKIRTLKISALEIDLSNIREIDTIEQLSDLLVKDISIKKWLYNASVEKKLAHLNTLGTMLQLTDRGFATHVDNCPMNVRNFHGKPFANYRLDCLDCEFLGSFPDSKSILCFGKRATEARKIIASFPYHVQPTAEQLPGFKKRRQNIKSLLSKVRFYE